jgi:biotin transport system substrate-specific component
MFDALAMVCGTAALYVCGVSWLKLVTGMAWSKALGLGVIPFIPGDIAKIIAATLLIKSLRQLTAATQATGQDPVSAAPLRVGK